MVNLEQLKALIADAANMEDYWRKKKQRYQAHAQSLYYKKELEKEA